jgi:N-acetylmuramoyl-L-alanine amidase
MPGNLLLLRLSEVYSGEKIRHPKLRAVTLAQWMLESGRATSKLATEHYNFGGLKWRKEMIPYASKISYEAIDGVDIYCKFATIESFINGYWAFLNRAPYTGWEEHVSTAEDFINFIGPIYTPSAGYADKVIDLVPEAADLLSAVGANFTIASAKIPATATVLGTVVIDPGHGGTSNKPGSSANNAISFSGVKEKKLTLDFCLILRDELRRQSDESGEEIDVVLTRTTDKNLSGLERAGTAFSEGAKLFLCFHFNGLDDTDVSGAETYFRAKSNGNLNLEDDIAFARAVHVGLIEGLTLVNAETKDRGVKPDTESGPGSLGVLNDKSLGNDKLARMCASAYIEAEFITNPVVDKILVSGPGSVANRTTVMASLASAIRRHMKEID